MNCPGRRLLAHCCGLLVILLAAVAGAEDAAWYRSERALYAGIPVQVRFTPADEALAARVWAYLESVDEGFNDWRDTSEIGRINAGGPGTYRLSGDMLEAFDLSERMHGLTGGAFELTVGPLRRLWRGAEKTGVWPTDAELATVRASIGPGTFRREGAELTVLKPGVKFDFGGIIKGMAVDRAVALLRAAGCTAGLVQVGGETGCWGMSPHGRPHRLAVPHPDAPDDLDRLWCRLQDPGQGMCGSTSGNYRNAIQVGDRTLYHIYDPRTGMPTDVHVLSVSVVFAGTGRNGMADGLTKAGIVLGPAGLPFIERAGGEALILVRQADGTITTHATKGWERFAVPAEASR